MANFDQLAASGSAIFLEQDQEALLARYPLPADESFIHIRFLGRPFRVERATGRVLGEEGPAGPGETLAILDMLCNPAGKPVMLGRWCGLQELSGAVSAPSDLSLFQHAVDRFVGRTERLRACCKRLGGREVPGGDVSCLIEVFEGFDTWLQFWDADDEFPVKMTFLWDKSAQVYLHYETVWYIMGVILGRLAEADRE